MTAPMSQATTRASVERVRPRLRLGPLLLVRRIRVVVACLVLCALAAGIITSLIGGPYMVALLVRTSRKATA